MLDYYDLSYYTITMVIPKGRDCTQKRLADKQVPSGM